MKLKEHQIIEIEREGFDYKRMGLIPTIINARPALHMSRMMSDIDTAVGVISPNQKLTKVERYRATMWALQIEAEKEASERGKPRIFVDRPKDGIEQ